MTLMARYFFEKRPAKKYTEYSMVTKHSYTFDILAEDEISDEISIEFRIDFRHLSAARATRLSVRTEFLTFFRRFSICAKIARTL